MPASPAGSRVGAIVFFVAPACGLLIGVCLGALGGGGSILTVPALVYLLDQTPHAATTGSLVVVGVAAVAGVVAHVRGGTARVRAGLAFGGLGVLGSFVGSRLSAGADPDLLLAGFAVLMIAAAAAMMRRPRADANAEPCATDRVGITGETGSVLIAERAPALSTRRAGVFRLVGAATGVGLLTGFFGVGGGFVVVPALVVVLGFEMPVAVGTSLIVIAVNSASALVARADSVSDVDWTAVGVLAATASVAALAGQRVARRVAPEHLTAAFSALLFVVAAYTACRSIPHLF